MALSWTENTIFLINQLRKDDFLQRFDHIFTLIREGPLIYHEHILVAAIALLIHYCTASHSACDSGEFK